MADPLITWAEYDRMVGEYHTAMHEYGLLREAYAALKAENEELKAYAVEYSQKYTLEYTRRKNAERHNPNGVDWNTPANTDRKA